MAAATNPAAFAGGLCIRSGVPEDAEAIARLINETFVVERIAFDGDRTNPRDVRAHMHVGNFLLAEDPSGIVSCVYLELRGERSYLGLLSVAPALQGKGLGRQLVTAAEDYSRSAGCQAMDLRIISPRSEALVPFYRRLGYSETGTAPFPADVQVKVPCHYIVMSKSLA